MQPAPTEAFQNATSVETTQDSTTSSQHGLPDFQQPAPRSPPHEAVGEPGNDAADPETTRGRQPNAGRINLRNDSSQESSPGSRIDEYERANAVIRRPSDGMVFQVIPNAKGKPSNVSIQEFPNGNHRSYMYGCANADTSQRS